MDEQSVKYYKNSGLSDEQISKLYAAQLENGLIDPLGSQAQGDTSSPENVTSAQSLSGSQDYNGECQRFVEQETYGKTGLFPSAIDAWQNYVKGGQARGDLQNIKPGDLVYFSPNSGNEGYGHTGIYSGNNQFVSATDNGVETQDLNAWQQATGQQVLGYVPTGRSN